MKLRLFFLVSLFLIAASSLSAAIVNEEGKAQYYTTTSEALDAAGDDQLIAIKFFTDW